MCLRPTPIAVGHVSAFWYFSLIAAIRTKRRKSAETELVPTRSSVITRLKDSRTFKLCVRMLITFALLSLLPLGASARPKTVLTIYSDERLTPTDQLIDATLRNVLDSKEHDTPDYLSEFLDFSRFDNSGYDKLASDFLRKKYGEQRLDVIVAVGPLAFRFLSRHQTDLFKGVPVVVIGIGRGSLQAGVLPPNFVGVPISIDPLLTIELALRLQPNTKELVIVTGTSEFDRLWDAGFRSVLPRLKTSVPIRYLSGLPLEDVLRELSHLPANSSVFCASFYRDSVGGTYISANAVRQMADASTAPMYGFYSNMIGLGVVGAHTFRMEDLGRQAGVLVQRILNGEKLSEADMPPTVAFQYFADWKQLQRWHLSEARLPPGTIVLDREPSLWERHKTLILGGISLMLAETLLIGGLLWQKARRNGMEKSLRDRLAFESLLSEVSTTFINLPEERIASNIDQELGRIAALLQIDRIAIYEFSYDRKELTINFSWSKQGAPPARSVIKTDLIPWWRSRTVLGKVLLTSDVDALGDEMAAEKIFLQEIGTRSLASIPLELGGEVLGAMAFVSTTRRVVWSDDLVKRLKMLAEVFSNALGRKQTDARIRESEERFRLVANTAPVLIWMSGADKLCTYFNQGWLDFTGRPIEAELGNGWAEGVHWEDLDRCLEIYNEAFDRRERFTMEYRLRSHDGEFRWILDVGVPRFNKDGSFAGYIGSAIDVTNRREAEQAIATVSGRLIEAQEGERQRIARELHDDISQRLALLSIDLQALADARPRTSAELRDRTEKLLERIFEISKDVHALSHRLHSSKLQTMGLVAAMRDFCSEFTAQQGVTIDFLHSDVPKSLPADISLCLFRILQEALYNGAKHSGVQQFHAELQGVSGALLLTIQDSGVGFDPEAAMKNRGLGLISMRERVGLVKGTISIASKPTLGTEIRVRIPVEKALAASAAQMTLPGVRAADETPEDIAS
jgi:PAS domain S-box-containing protein